MHRMYRVEPLREGCALKSVYRILVVAFVSVGIAALLSIVPKLDGSLAGGAADTPVFRPESAVMLSDRNLVDLLVKLPLQLDIAHVEWSDSILSVDLRSGPDGLKSESVYDDLYVLSQAGFAGTKNVKRMLVRLMEHPSQAKGVPQLLMAMDAKRSDADGAAAGGRLKGTKEQYIVSSFNLTYTHRWMDRLQH